MEVAVGCSVFGVDVWFARGLEDPSLHRLCLALLAGLFVMSAWRRRHRASVPRRTQRWSWTWAVGLTLVGLAAVVGGGALLREPFEPFGSALEGTDVPAWLGSRVGIAVGQQMALHLFLVPVLAEVLGSPPRAVAAAAAVFGAAHLPSPVLAGATTLGALGWAGLYVRDRRLAPLVASHLVLTCALQLALPSRLHRDMQIGTAAPEARIGDLDRSRQLYDRLLSSDFQGRFEGDLGAYVEGAFLEALGREPTPVEAERWKELAAQTSREEAAARLVRIQLHSGTGGAAQGRH